MNNSGRPYPSAPGYVCVETSAIQDQPQGNMVVIPRTLHRVALAAHAPVVSEFLQKTNRLKWRHKSTHVGRLRQQGHNLLVAPRSCSTQEYTVATKKFVCILGGLFDSTWSVCNRTKVRASAVWSSCRAPKKRCTCEVRYFASLCKSSVELTFCILHDTPRARPTVAKISNMVLSMMLAHQNDKVNK